jgi:pimeloyl-ACP methyl ester carboxylesterase
MYLRRDDADLLVTAFGPGPRTLVAHGGWVGSGELWLPPFEYLSRTWRTVTYDHRGTGSTVTRAPEITFEALVDDLFAVLDALAIERCVIAGESAGAAVVLEAALRQPNRFEGLVIVAGRQNGTLSPRIEAMLEGCRLDFAATMTAFVNACVPEPDCTAERLWGQRIVMRSDAKSAIELMTCMKDINLTPRLGEIAMPVLILHGARDAIRPLAETREMAARLPRARVVVADDAGHVPTITRPHWVATEIDSFFASGG